MNTSMLALVWFIAGVALFVAELAVPGIILVFVAIGAWAAAALIWTGVIETLSASLAVFAFVSVASLLLLRKYLTKIFKGRQRAEHDSFEESEDFVGGRAKVIEEIDESRNSGKIDFRGVNWRATSSIIIPAGSTVEIIARDNLSYRVRIIKEDKP